MTIGALLGDLVALVVLVVLVGMAYQTIGSARYKRRFPPPGQMVDVGGYCLHIHHTVRNEEARYPLHP